MFSLCKLHIVHFPLRIEGRFILMMGTVLYLLANTYMTITAKKAQPALRCWFTPTGDLQKVPSVNTIDINYFTTQSSGNFFSLFVWLVTLQNRNRNSAIIWISFHNLYIPAQIVTTRKSIRNSWPVELDCSTDSIYHELFAKSYEIS